MERTHVMPNTIRHHDELATVVTESPSGMRGDYGRGGGLLL